MTSQPVTPPNFGDPTGTQPVRVVNQIGVWTIAIGVAIGSILGVILGTMLIAALGVSLT